MLKLDWLGLRRKGERVIAQRVVEYFTRLRCDPLNGTGRCSFQVAVPFDEGMREVQLDIVRLAGSARLSVEATPRVEVGRLAVPMEMGKLPN